MSAAHAAVADDTRTPATLKGLQTLRQVWDAALPERLDGVIAEKTSVWRTTRDVMTARELALLHRKAPDPGQGVAAIADLLTVHGDDPLLLSAHAEALTDAHRPDEALVQARRALRAAPELAAPWVALARGLAGQARFQDAIKACLSACQAEPANHAPGATLADIAATAGWTAATLVDHLKGVKGITAGQLYAEALLATEDQRSAVAAIEACLGLAQEDPDLFRTAAAILGRAGEPQKALSLIERAASLSPSADVAFERIRLLQELDRHREAFQLASERLRTCAEHRGAFADQAAMSATHLGRHDEARSCLALTSDEDFFIPGLGQMRLGVEAYCYDDAELLRRHAEQVARANAVPEALRVPWCATRPSDDRRLRLGLISNNFAAHPVAWLTLAAFERLAATDELDIICFETHVRESDPWRNRFRALASEWHDVSHRDDFSAASFIGQSDIDVLIDLQGYSRKSKTKLLFYKPAPVIVKWIGMQCASSGIKEMDYFISDDVETPSGFDVYFTEKLIRLPRSYVAFEIPELPDLPPAPPCLKQGRVTFGYFNNLQKMSIDTFDAWCRLLHRLPEASLLLKAPQLSDPEMVRELGERFARRGVPIERLMFRGRTSRLEHLRAMASVDIGLDAFPYSGGVSTLESLAVGVPVVTLAGKTFAARHSASHLSWSGVPELIATTPEDYIEIAVGLARDPERLLAYRGSLPEGLRRPGGPADIDGFCRDFRQVLQDLSKEARERKARRPTVRLRKPILPIKPDIADAIEQAFALGGNEVSPEWAMPKATLAEILGRLSALRPAVVLEFGPGVSTLAMLLLAEKLGVERVIAFEHDPAWADKLRSWTSRVQATCLLELRERALVPRTWGSLSGSFYDLTEDDLSIRANAIVIDGPPSGLRSGLEFRRAMAAVAIEHCLSPGGVVLMEDASRLPEMAGWRAWMDSSLLADCEFLHVGRGLFAGRP